MQKLQVSSKGGPPELKAEAQPHPLPTCSYFREQSGAEEPSIFLPLSRCEPSARCFCSAGSAFLAHRERIGRAGMKRGRVTNDKQTLQKNGGDMKWKKSAVLRTFLPSLWLIGCLTFQASNLGSTLQSLQSLQCLQSRAGTIPTKQRYSDTAIQRYLSLPLSLPLTTKLFG